MLRTLLGAESTPGLDPCGILLASQWKSSPPHSARGFGTLCRVVGGGHESPCVQRRESVGHPGGLHLQMMEGESAGKFRVTTSVFLGAVCVLLWSSESRGLFSDLSNGRETLWILQCPDPTQVSAATPWSCGGEQCGVVRVWACRPFSAPSRGSKQDEAQAPKDFPLQGAGAGQARARLWLCGLQVGALGCGGPHSTAWCEGNR